MLVEVPVEPMVVVLLEILVLEVVVLEVFLTLLLQEQEELTPVVEVVEALVVVLVEQVVQEL